MYTPILTAVGQAMLDDRHRQAERDSLALTARRASRARKRQAGHRAVSRQGVIFRRARANATPDCC